MTGRNGPPAWTCGEPGFSYQTGRCPMPKRRNHPMRHEPHSRRGRIVIGRTGGRLVAARQRESVVVFGPPGSGKTSAFAIPNILEWDGPAVVCSVTSEILHTTLRSRSSHERMACVYEPTGALSGIIRAGWDPVPQCADFQKSTRLAHH